MISKLNKIISFLCEDWGFCIPASEKNKILSLKKLRSDEFACLILLAEGFDPEIEIEWRRKIRNKFVEIVGSSILGSDDD